MWQKPNSLPLFFALSLIFHLMGFSLFHMPAIEEFKGFLTWKLTDEEKKELEEQMKQIKMLGKKDGPDQIKITLHPGDNDKKPLSRPNLSKSKVEPKREKDLKPDEQKKNLSLDDLAMKEMTKGQDHKNEKPKANSRTFRKDLLKNETALKSLRMQGNQAAQEMQRTGRLSSTSPVSPYLSNSDFNIDIQLPKGHNEDELNKEELQYYSFQKRTIETYISSYLKNLFEWNRNFPHAPIVDPSDYLQLKAQVTYDENGHIRSIRVLRNSPREDVQKFFINVLEGIVLPNPPKGLLNTQNQFTYYFTLNIRG